MSNNPNKSKKMYTSTPFRNDANCSSISCNEMNRSADEEELTEIECNQQYYSVPKVNVNDNNEFQNLPDAYTYSSIMPRQLNEEELELVIGPSDSSDESYTNFKTPNTSCHYSNDCRPIYFENVCSNHSSTNNKSTDTDHTKYIGIPFNMKEYCKATTSGANCNDSSTICSKNKKFFMGTSAEYKDLKYFREKARHDSTSDSGDEEDEDDDLPPRTSIINKKPRCTNNVTWDPICIRNDKSKKIGKPHLTMETYPCSTHHQMKTNHWVPSKKCNISFGEEQEIPPFLHSCDSIDPSKISSCSNDEMLDSLYLKYPLKEDLSAKSDSINMLSVVISTVMLLASKSQVPQNYITWTLKYLKCIKNKQGQYPPNIKRIQKMLTVPTDVDIGTSSDTLPGQGQGQGQGQWQCRDCLIGQNPGKRMDLTKKRRKPNNK